MKNQIKTLCTFAFIAALLNGCKIFPPDDLFPDISKYTVYVAGQYDFRISCYWKNGERTDLNTAENYMRATTTGMSVSNGNVYLSGYYMNGDISNHVPCFWKNGIKTDLSLDGKLGGYTNDIFVSGSDVYVVGMYIVEEQSYRKETLKPCYWKNNTLIEITDYPNLFDISLDGDYNNPMTLPSVELVCIYVSGNDVYIGGNYDKGSKKDNSWGEQKQACYWKNGVRTDLPGNNSFVSGIFVDGGKVYASGGYDFSMPGFKNNKLGRPCYWVQGQKVDLQSSAYNASTSAIFVENGSVYVSGYGYEARGSNSCYWKDKTKTQLDNKAEYTGSIFVKDGIVFTCGGIIEMTYEIPCYWANKKRMELSVTERNGEAITIFVE